MFPAFFNQYEVLPWGAASALRSSAKAALPDTQLLAESWKACVGRYRFFHMTPTPWISWILSFPGPSEVLASPVPWNPWTVSGPLDLSVELRSAEPKLCSLSHV